MLDGTDKDIVHVFHVESGIDVTQNPLSKARVSCRQAG